MTNWFLYMVEQERRRDEIARAAEHNYSRQLQKEHDAVTELPLRRHERVLAALGDRLVDWGYRLQTRYRHLAENNVSADALLAQQKADSAGCA